MSKTIEYKVKNPSDDWVVPNLHIIESEDRYSLKFTLNGEDVTDKSLILKACNFYAGGCRYRIERFKSGKKFDAAKRELKYLTEYANMNS